MKSKYWGILILILVAIGVVVYPMVMPTPKEEVNITGYLGGEKKGLLSNPEFQKLIKKKYNLEIDYKVLGSLDMIHTSSEDKDYLFPSSQLAMELFQKQGKKSTVDEIIFNTPIVLYSRQKVVSALDKAGVIAKEGDVHYVDMVKLGQMMKAEKSWKDIGLSELNSRIFVTTTNPNESNSGNMFLGLLANAFNNNEMVDKDNVKDILPILKKIYKSQGYMQGSSSDMFNQFMRMGYGAYPLIAGYESQLLEFSKQNDAVYQQVKDDIVILYPKPTVWSSHVFIGLNDQTKVAAQALSDPQVQELAWKSHGFRTIVSGTADTKEFPVPGLVKDVTHIMSMPSIEVMEILMDAIK